MLILATCFFANAQDGRPEFYTICGHPQNESVSAIRLSGRVTQIVDSDTVVIKTEDKSRTVNLVTVDVSSNEHKARRFLSKKILNQHVLFFIYGTQNNENQIFADVFYDEVYSASRSLITKGIVRYKKPDVYTFSKYKACVYQRLEEMAKEDKIGIWAK